MGEECFTVVVAVNDLKVLERNLLLSPGIKSDNMQLIIKRDCISASLAYNEAIEEADNEIIIFVHQDVYLPETWFAGFKKSLSYLEKEKISWGVLGCFGSRPGGAWGIGRVCTNGMGYHGNEIDRPEPVQTLDEIVLVIRKSSGLRFDPTLPHFHLYGTDICMSAKDMGLMSYAIPAFCVHNTNQLVNLPIEFYNCYRHVKIRWGKYLPIYTSCITISRFDREVRVRRIREASKRFLRESIVPACRVEDPRALMRDK
jgi:hypothetical protein